MDSYEVQGFVDAPVEAPVQATMQNTVENAVNDTVQASEILDAEEERKKDKARYLG